MCLLQVVCGRVYAVEQPRDREMFTHSDLAELRRHLLPHHRAVLGQCQYGASVDEQPIKKATEINSNVDIASSSVDLNRKCQKNHDHNQLQ